MESTSKHGKHILAILLLGALSAPALAQESGAGPEVGVNELLDMLRRQDEQLQQQRQRLDEQAKLLATQNDAIQSLQARVDVLGATDVEELTAAERAIRARLEALETTVAESPVKRETTTDYDETEFPGALPLPGTNAALRIGGFVKANLVQSLDALGSQNRFIVGTIPTRGAFQGDKEAVLSVQQSRLNLELRENTQAGQLRAFIEGDFAGGEDEDVFRLRHAFGQFKDFMAGKTWTNFMDIESSPEEIDFEGINGTINARQTQLRYFPQLGQDWNLIISLEDPQPDVTDGRGISQLPDFVASIRGDVQEVWNIKASVLLRSLKARWELDDNVRDSINAWGFSVSGRRFVQWFGNRRDSLSFELNYGEGYGRYINDLSTVGGKDAVFDSEGKLNGYQVFAGYVSLQKWWKDTLRSTFIASVVDIDNFVFEPDDAYDKTWRVSGNLIWSPVPRIDIGGELLLGERKDKDGASGQAAQFQGSVRYRF
ncbi:MAG: DcaP family trimeric outer membrane transporter [Gammaproteobacteria bacterium]|nr:DcaP family trimeric outer membrane transporter [Gammaproteobacteria bacterium]